MLVFLHMRSFLISLKAFTFSLEQNFKNLYLSLQRSTCLRSHRSSPRWFYIIKQHGRFELVQFNCHRRSYTFSQISSARSETNQWIIRVWNHMVAEMQENMNLSDGKLEELFIETITMKINNDFRIKSKYQS